MRADDVEGIMQAQSNKEQSLPDINNLDRHFVRNNSSNIDEARPEKDGDIEQQIEQLR